MQKERPSCRPRAADLPCALSGEQRRDSLESREEHFRGTHSHRALLRRRVCEEGMGGRRVREVSTGKGMCSLCGWLGISGARVAVLPGESPPLCWGSLVTPRGRCPQSCVWLSCLS